MFGHVASYLITNCVYTELACLDNSSEQLSDRKGTCVCAFWEQRHVKCWVFIFTSLLFFSYPCALSVPFSLSITLSPLSYLWPDNFLALSRSLTHSLTRWLHPLPHCHPQFAMKTTHVRVWVVTLLLRTLAWPSWPYFKSPRATTGMASWRYRAVPIWILPHSHLMHFEGFNLLGRNPIFVS